MSLTLDRLTEELHSLDEQISALYLLQTTHNGSALAMALRKLNTSFIKKIAENQMLRNQVSALEAERDEAWQHAESLAREYDQVVAEGPPAILALPGKIGTSDWTTATAKPLPPSAMRPASGQSHRISATRKGSIRRSKAGLRTSAGFQSKRASVASARLVSARTPLSRDSLLQPVPRLPKLHVKTGGISPSGARASTARSIRFHVFQRLTFSVAFLRITQVTRGRGQSSCTSRKRRVYNAGYHSPECPAPPNEVDKQRQTYPPIALPSQQSAVPWSFFSCTAYSSFIVALCF